MLRNYEPEVSMDRIGYLAGYLRFFWIRIGFGYFEKNWIRTASGYWFDFYMVAATEW